MLSRRLFLSTALAAPAWTQTKAVKPPRKDRFHLFLLIGQSNMAGRGLVADEDRKPNPRVLSFNKEGLWVPAVDPLHWDKPEVIGVGIGRSFAFEVLKANPGITVGLIPCAVGGSPIDAWKPGVFYEPTKSHPWDDAIRRAKLALPAGTFKGMLWHQGESDSTPELAPTYQAKLDDLIGRFRSELNAPEVPFLAGQLGQFPDSPWNEARKQVDAVHRSLPSRVKAAAFVPSDGLNHKGDKVHFDAASYRKLGKRYASAYLRLGKG
ncbi:MAG: sialate O-acetylesterase [Bryobacterales bacterium]|nr:sialate O-acetylesterase [Bryobacterales bacterium]